MSVIGANREERRSWNTRAQRAHTAHRLSGASACGSHGDAVPQKQAQRAAVGAQMRMVSNYNTPACTHLRLNQTGSNRKMKVLKVPQSTDLHDFTAHMHDNDPELAAS